MCGIVGRIGRGLVDLGAALDAIAHRGPDDRGTWRGAAGDDTVDLGFVRLAILDVSPQGHQPISNEDGSIWCICNGEIYNFRELRAELQAQGHHFASRSDSETVLHCYEQYGDAFVHRLRGMFAIALWDCPRERLLLIRDRLGIKPLYWADRDGALTFGSEVKALLALGLRRELDASSVGTYLRHLYVPGPHTMFRGVHALLPGHRLVHERGRTRVERWWNLTRPPQWRNEEQLVEAIRHVLEETVRQHMASDVPLGAFLSGGIDSSTIVALMAAHSPEPVRTFCVTFGRDEELYDEREHARAVAARFGTRHTEIPVETDIVELLPKMVRHFDAPFGNPTALLVWALSRETRKHVTVALAGDGGDEIFLGYPRYRGAHMARRYQLVPRALRAVIARAAGPLIRESSRGDHRLRRAREFLESGLVPPEIAYERWATYFSQSEVARLVGSERLNGVLEQPGPIARFFAEAPGIELEDRVCYVDLKSFLPENLLQYTDRMSMAHALEVRVPFCDHRLVELLASVPFEQKMPHGTYKYLLRKATSDLLPKEVRLRPKVGFNPPMGIWLNRDLKQLLDTKLEPAKLRREGMFDAQAVATLVEQHRSGHRDFSLHIWSLLVLQTFLEDYGLAA